MHIEYVCIAITVLGLRARGNATLQQADSPSYKIYINNPYCLFGTLDR